MDRGVDVGREPIDPPQVRIAFGDLPQPIMRKNRDRALSEGQHIVVEPLERESMKIGEVARDMQLCELALAALEVLAPRHPTFEQKKAGIQLDAGVDSDFVRANPPRFRDGTADCPLFLRADLGTLTQRFQMNADHEGRLVQRLSEIALNLGYMHAPFRKSFDYKAKGHPGCNTGESFGRDAMLINRHSTGVWGVAELQAVPARRSGQDHQCRMDRGIRRRRCARGGQEPLQLRQLRAVGKEPARRTLPAEFGYFAFLNSYGTSSSSRRSCSIDGSEYLASRSASSGVCSRK